MIRSMSENNFGPYRATALWNEAVVIFKEGIQLKTYRHRLHKHENTFTGQDAVSFLHKELLRNNLFKPDISSQQIQQLLTHFLKANLVQTVKCGYIKKDDTFRNSSKHHYEFTDDMINFEAHNPDYSLTKMQNKPEYSENPSSPTQTFWKSEIIKRIENLMETIGLNADICSFLVLGKIEAKWVSTNNSPDWIKIRWNTNLPSWVLGAFHKFLKSPVEEKSAFPKFGPELLKIISDYFSTLESPLILPCYNKLICDFFERLVRHKELPKLRRYRSMSQENLLLDISLPSAEEDNWEMERRSLPPESCYEAAFTSDHPITRIVPQSSFDVIHLKSQKQYKENQYNEFNFLKSYSSMKDICGNGKIDKIDSKRRPLRVVQGYDNSAFSFNPKVPKYSEGVVNPGFSCYNEEKSNYWNEVKMKSRSSDDIDDYAYVNHGMNCSFEDETGFKLDYADAIESVNRLLEASQPKRKSICSDDQSFYSANSLSFNGSNHKETDQSILEDSMSSSSIKIGVTFFQLIFMLLPPSNRARLRLLFKTTRYVSSKTTLQELSFANMMKTLKKSILNISVADNPNYEEIGDKILFFIAENSDSIFSDLSDANSTEEQHDFCKTQRFSFCEQISKDKFVKQREVQSSIALSQLIEQIMGNDRIPKSEQKKYLKKFKNMYPEIYQQHCLKTTSGIKALRV